MKTIKVLFALIFVASVAASPTFAQSNFGFYYGFVPTAGQWNSYFSAKQDVLGYTPVNKAGDTMLGRLITAPSTASASGLRIGVGDDVTSPTNGDLWITINGLYYRANNATFGPLYGPTNFAANYPLSLSTVGALTTVSLDYSTNFSLVGNQLALSTSGIALNSPTGGQEGAGTINVSTGYYVNGGPIPKMQGGTGADLSATGGAHQYLAQTSAGGSITPQQPSFTDMSDSIAVGQIPNSLITNAKLANAAAWTFKCNNSSSSAAPGDCTIDGLTSKASPTGSDEVAIWDAAASAMKKSTVTQLVGAVGVSSIAGNTGAFTLNGLLSNTGNVLQVLAASKSDQQAGSSGVVAVTPAFQQAHDSAAKAWAIITPSTGAVLAGYNVSSVTRNSAGNYTANFTTPFASANYACTVNGATTTSAGQIGIGLSGSTASAYNFATIDRSAGSAADATVSTAFHCFGRQ